MRQRILRRMKLLNWANVAVATVATAGFLGLYYLSDSDGKTALITVVSSSVTAFVGVAVHRKMQQMEVQQKLQQAELEAIRNHVNGNTRALIDKIPMAERPDEVPQV